MTRVESFAKNSAFTLLTSILNLVLSIFVTIIIARLLGPEGKGIYTVITVFPYLIVTLGSLGVPSATAFYVAKQSYTRPKILGNTVLTSLITGTLGMIVGLIIATFWGHRLFPGISQKYLILALLTIPPNMLFIHLQYTLLGAQYIKGYNLVSLIHNSLLLAFTILLLWVFKMKVIGALTAIILSYIFANIFTFVLTIKVSGGIKLQMDYSYLKNALRYGLQIYISNTLRFLSLRVNLFLVNGLLNPAAVGFYSISTGLTEKLLLISQAAATVLFPKIAMEEDDIKRKEFTPVIARAVLWLTLLTALIIFVLSQWLIGFLYSQTFLPAVAPLRILLLGTIAVSLSQILGNDIAGRGQPILNVYANIVGFISVVVLSVLWIPKYGIEGAAWASTVSYVATTIILLLFYARISGNFLTAVLLPKRADWELYWQTGKTLWHKSARK